MQSSRAQSSSAKLNSSGNGNDVGENDVPACQSCRKKKSKCSREQPCSQCEQLNIECIYDDKKIRPGIRLGAVESLSQRVAALENMFLGQGLLLQPLLERAAMLGEFSSASNMPIDVELRSDSLSARVNELKQRISQTDTSLQIPTANRTTEQQLNHSASKRRRGDDVDSSIPHSSPEYIWLETSETRLPPNDLIDGLVDIYFANIHPWIPILHVKDFRRRMKDSLQRSSLNNIFHAIVSLCARFSTDPRLSNPETRAHYSKQSREIVILQSMESFSVVNLQAMVIIAFDTIGSGRGPSAWSIVGSMTRTVEQLQLNVEDDSDTRSEGAVEFLIQRMAFLEAPVTWVETEERRRLFWIVFLMDRFCSVATGWNPSLASADVRRRLPAEGALWEVGSPVRTPYFGAADKPISTSTGLASDTQSVVVDPEEVKSIGGFAYCIEATESLSLVTTFFLKHALNVENIQEVQIWLMRFKELDLRLIRWKLFLPSEWREASVLNKDGIMDPNLTLAHITHNTSVILLHQGVGYPSLQWRSCPIILPSSSSAKTCIAAAAEVATIAHQYLLNSSSPTNPQFAFCLFISGRVLHAHANFYHGQFPAEFDTLLSALQEIARRWAGPYGQNVENLASRFASRLMKAKISGPMTSNSALDIRQPVYAEKNDFIDATRSDPATLTRTLDDTSVQSPNSISLAFPPLPNSFLYSTNDPPRNAMMHLSPKPSNPASQNLIPENVIPLNMTSGNKDDISDLLEGSFEEFIGMFEDPFAPYQRISTFSRGNLHENQVNNQ